MPFIKLKLRSRKPMSNIWRKIVAEDWNREVKWGHHGCRTHYHQFRGRHFERRRRREVMKRMKMTVNQLLPHYQDHQERGIVYGKVKTRSALYLWENYRRISYC